MKLKKEKDMKDRELFYNLRSKKGGWVSLNTRLTVVVVAEVLACVLIAFGIISLVNLLVPELDNKVPLIIQTVLLSLVVIGVATRFLSRIFFDPIKQIRNAMQKVADGDFSVRLNTTTKVSKEMREVYAGFNLMMDELSATEILQTDFVSNVSHEFKTPINAIEGYTTLLQDCENLNADQKEYVEKILFNTGRLSTLVGNILLLSKIENQSIRTNKTRFRLDEQIRQSIVALEPRWSEKDIEIDAELESIEYTGSENLLHHVWDNIIGNAVKFDPVGGSVRIGLEKKDGLIIFTVEDNGPGLSPTSQKHLFEKFYQEDSSHKQEGNGLGLALVKRILSIEKGDIYAENIDGGCRFTVKLIAN